MSALKIHMSLLPETFDFSSARPAGRDASEACLQGEGRGSEVSARRRGEPSHRQVTEPSATGVTVSEAASSDEDASQEDGLPEKARNVVYYVEDDKNLRELTVYALKQTGIDAFGCDSDVEFRRACAEHTPDAVLLDIMLPDADGYEILSRIRQTPGLSHVPIMMLSARDAELDKVRALDGGADDYLSKPFGMMEMVSRTRALLRRAGRDERYEEVEELHVGPVTLWPERREATLEGEELKLTMREFDLLCFLMRSPGVVFSRETLLQRVWGWDFDGGSRTVDVHVRQLRAKLGASSGLIETVRGVGYRMKG
jgi:two-component system alkaline phosphatase synthesis response regulator PhoP